MVIKIKRSIESTVVEPHDGLGVVALDLVPASGTGRASAALPDIASGHETRYQRLNIVNLPRKLLENRDEVHIRALLHLARVWALELAKGDEA